MQGAAESAEEDNGHSIFRTFTMPPPEEKRPVPYSGVVEVPAHECLEQKQVRVRVSVRVRVGFRFRVRARVRVRVS